MLHSVSQCQCAAPAAPKYMHLAADVQLLSKRNNVFYQILGFIIAERCLGVGRNVWFAFSATTLVIQDDPVALGIKETSHLRIVGASSTWPSMNEHDRFARWIAVLGPTDTVRKRKCRIILDGEPPRPQGNTLGILPVLLGDLACPSHCCVRHHYLHIPNSHSWTSFARPAIGRHSSADFSRRCIPTRAPTIQRLAARLWCSREGRG